MFHRPLSRPLAVVALLSLFDYLLWTWSLDGSHDIFALIAGLTLVPLLIALAWLLVKGATRALAEMTRRTRAISAARIHSDSSARRGAGEVRAAARRSSPAARGAPVGSRAAREQSAVASTDAGEASSKASPSSKLAA